jgi:catechol 2,3-dioxygenase-like lactoylglutathione lyase family enzyme
VTRFLAIMPVLRVADLQRSIEWYVGVLGLHLDRRWSSDEDGENCFIRAGDLELLLSTGAHLGGPPSFTGTLYFRVVGVDALYEVVRDRPEIVWPLERQEYGTREFGIRDPDGYVLAFAEMADSSAE